MKNNLENQIITIQPKVEAQLWKVEAREIEKIRAKMIAKGELPISQTIVERKKYDMQGLFSKLAQETLFPNSNSAASNIQRITEASTTFISTTKQLEKAYQNQEISDQQLEMATFLIKYQYQAYIRNK